MKVDKSYWSSDLPIPLSPSNQDVDVYRSFLMNGDILLLGCTKQLVPISDYQMDIDPWCTGPNVIISDWRDNKQYYNNIIGDGVLNFTKELADQILDMCSNHCDVFIARSFNKKLPIMRIADNFPKESDFKIKPNDIVVFDDYSFFVWTFKKS